MCITRFRLAKASYKCVFQVCVRLKGFPLNPKSSLSLKTTFESLCRNRNRGRLGSRQSSRRCCTATRCLISNCLTFDLPNNWTWSIILFPAGLFDPVCVRRACMSMHLSVAFVIHLLASFWVFLYRRKFFAICRRMHWVPWNILSSRRLFPSNGNDERAHVTPQDQHSHTSGTVGECWKSYVPSHTRTAVWMTNFFNVSSALSMSSIQSSFFRRVCVANTSRNQCCKYLAGKMPCRMKEE